MDRFQKFCRSYGGYIGGTFTLLVVGLLLYGHIFAFATIPQNASWIEQPGLHICDTAPSWAQENSAYLQEALIWWAKRGWTFREVRSGPCVTSCEMIVDKDTEIDAACMPGWVTLDLRGQWGEMEHIGVCIRSQDEIEWAAIRIPNVISEATDINAPILPIDVEALVLAHEIGHCLSGLEHVQGPSLFSGMRLNPPKGNVMNPTVTHGGWDDEGVPQGDW